MDPLQPPEHLHRSIENLPDGVRFRSERTQTYLLGLCLLVGAALVAVPYGSGAFLDTGAVLAATFLSLTISFILGMVLAVLPRQTVVQATGISFTGWFAPRIPRPARLYVEGTIGRGQRLVADSGDEAGATIEPLGRFEVDGQSGSVTHQDVTWLAQRSANLLGVPLRDERDPDLWNRYLSDPVFRCETDFDVELEDNREEFPNHHLNALTPTAHTVDLDGSRTLLHSGFFDDTWLELDPRHLRLGAHEVPLERVLRVGVVYRKVKTKNSTSYYGTLFVLTAVERIELVELSVQRDGGRNATALNWAAQAIAAAAETARPASEAGTVADIPAALAPLRQRNESRERSG